MKKVLFIDDNVSIAETVSLFLGRLGYQVKVAYDGYQGIDLLENGETFNVVVTDIRMPTISGNEVARYIRRTYRQPNIQVVAITGSIKDVETGLFDTQLLKPFKLKDLASLIGSL